MTKIPPDPLRDPARLAALRQLALLDAPSEAAFDRLTRLAVATLGVLVALVTLVDADRQFFASCVGLPEPWYSARQTPCPTCAGSRRYPLRCVAAQGGHAARR